MKASKTIREQDLAKLTKTRKKFDAREGQKNVALKSFALDIQCLVLSFKSLIVGLQNH